MAEAEVMLEAFERCELYLDEKCISNHLFFREYIRAIYNGENYNSAKSLSYVSSWHSNTILAGVLFFNALMSYWYNTFSVEDCINDLKAGDIVIYKGQRVEVTEINPRLKFRQDNGMVTGIDRKTWNRVAKYNNAAKVLDGRGVFKTINPSERREFFHELFGTEVQDVPVESNAIAVFLSDIDRIDYMVRNLKVRLRENSRMLSFLDLFTVTRVNSNGTDKNYPGNLWGGNPNIYICQNMYGVAQLIDDYQDDKRYSLISFYSDEEVLLAKDIETVGRLVKMQKIPRIVIDVHSNFRLGQNLRQCRESDFRKVFTPTLEFGQETEEKDPLLYKEWKAMKLGGIHELVFELKFNEDEYYQLLSMVSKIRNNKDEPVMSSKFVGICLGTVHSILSSVTAITCDEGLRQYDFESSIERLEEICKSFSSSMLRHISKDACKLVEKLYEEIKREHKKEKFFYELMVHFGRRKNIAVIAYKEKQVEAICSRYNGISLKLTAVTPKKFNLHNHYDVIIIVGQMNLYDIPIWIHNQSSKIYILLYDCEKTWLRKQKNWFYRNLQAFASKVELEQLIGIKNEAGLGGQTKEGQAHFVDIDNMMEGFLKGIQANLPKLLEAQQKQIGENKVEIAAIGILDDGREYLFSKGAKKTYVFTKEEERVKSKTVEEIEPGDKILYCRDLGNREDILVKVLEKQGEKSDSVQKAFAINEEWKRMLRGYKEKKNLTYEMLGKKLESFGTKITTATLRSWMDEDSNRIGPQKDSAFQAISRILQREPGVRSWEEYASATKVARNMHIKATKSITAHIRKIYWSYCQGKQPRDEIEEMLFENMDNLATLLTVEQIVSAEGLPKVYASLVNCPIELEDIIANG